MCPLCYLPCGNRLIFRLSLVVQGGGKQEASLAKDILEIMNEWRLVIGNKYLVVLSITLPYLQARVKSFSNLNYKLKKRLIGNTL